MIIGSLGCMGGDRQETAAASGTTDSERCATSRENSDGISSAIETLNTSSPATWEGTELLLTSAVSRYVATLEGAEHPGLATAHERGQAVEARVETLGPSPTAQTIETWTRDVLELAVEVSTHCLEVATADDGG